jgi:hypothetical protein
MPFIGPVDAKSPRYFDSNAAPQGNFRGPLQPKKGFFDTSNERAWPLQISPYTSPDLGLFYDVSWPRISAEDPE